MKYPYYKKYTRVNPQSGFTLVETLVAITILLVAIVGPMTIAARGLQSAFYAREQITAFFLAQEGVELVRAVRDQNALQTVDVDWLDNIDSACGSANGCGLDANSTTIHNCSSSTCRLNYDPDSLTSTPHRRGLYNYTAGTPSQFTRTVRVKEVTPGGSDREAEVTVEVSWQSGLFGGEKKVTVQSRIFNHYEGI